MKVQDDIKQTRRLKKLQKAAKADPQRMETLRRKFLQQAKRYFGVPYARKYWAKDTPEYKSPLFLDCCGLVRQVMRDLEADFGFRIGPWNQAYMYDTLPISLTEKQMKPGDLVFMSGTYTNPKSKKQRHNMMHVEIWLGDGPKTIGARWNNGKVKVFDSYKFSPKSFTNEQYYFRSIDTWLMGSCKSHCSQHRWGMSNFNPGKKSVFFPQQQNLSMQDEKAGDDESDDGNDQNDQRPATNPSQENTDNSGGSSSTQEEKKSDTPEFPDKEERDTPPETPKRYKKKSKKPRKVSKSSFLPQSTKTALLALEDRIDNMVAKKVDVFGSSRQQCPSKSSRGMKGRSLQRPATSLDMMTSADQKPLTSRSLSNTKIRCPVVGDCNEQPVHYIPSLMPRRQNCPLVTSRTAPALGELPDPRRPHWFDSPRAVAADKGSLTDRAPARGLLTVVGSGPQDERLKKNRSCTDLETVSRRPSKVAAAPGKTLRHSAPESLTNVNMASLSLSAEFVERVREHTPATPSLVATCSSDDNDDVIDSGSDDGNTSVGCVSDCCPSDMEEDDTMGGCVGSLEDIVVECVDTDEELETYITPRRARSFLLPSENTFDAVFLPQEEDAKTSSSLQANAKEDPALSRAQHSHDLHKAHSENVLAKRGGSSPAKTPSTPKDSAPAKRGAQAWSADAKDGGQVKRVGSGPARVSVPTRSALPKGSGHAQTAPPQDGDADKKGGESGGGQGAGSGK
ncbi:hypothetical protein BaRGS_00036408, partial [Batillaria attramentaria]